MILPLNLSIIGYWGWNKSKYSEARLLAEFDDIRAVGPLCEALSYGDEHTVKTIRGGLLQLLPRMKASDAGLLNADQKRSLYKTLGKNDEVWNVTTLRALEQIGDTAAVPFVLPLIRSKNAAIQQVAADCLPYLQDRETQERVRLNLLRAASAEDSPAVLLRPAQSAPEQNQTQLLRPSHQENGE